MSSMSSSPLMFSSDLGSLGSSDLYSRSSLGLFSFSDSGLSHSGNQNAFDRRLLPPDNGPPSRPQDASNMFSASSMRLGPQNSGGFSSGSQCDNSFTTQLNYLREENIRLRHENELVLQQARTWKTAFDKISYDLGQKVDVVTSELKIVSESLAMNGNPAVPTSGPSAASSISLFALLSKSKLLPRLDPEDYEGVGHWYPGTYRKLRRKLKSSGAEEEEAENELPGLGTGSTNLVQASVTRKDPVLSRFLEDKDGNPILEGQKKAILATAASFWQYLLDNKRAPKTFRKVNIEVKLQWQVLMESNYECLRYCDSHWKVDQVWINYYPSWLKTAKRKLAEEERGKKGKNVGGVIDIDTDDADELVGSDENDENEDSGEDGDQDTELLNANNKRGPTDSSNTDRSKRPRVEEPETPAARPRPQPKRVSANHPKANPLAHVRAIPAIPPTPAVENAPGTAGNETPPTSGAPPSGTSSGSSESLDTRPVSDSAPRISADNSMPRVAPAPGPLSSPPSVLPPTPPSSGTSSGSLESPPGRLSSGPPPSDSAVNLTSQIAPAPGPTSLASSAPPSAPSQGDSQNGPPAVDSAAATSLGTAPPQNTSLGTSATTTTASTSQPRSTSDPTPAIALTDTTGTQGTSNKKSTSKKSAPGKGSRKAAPKKDPKPKKMVLSKQLYYNDWMKENAENPDKDFEADWKALAMSVKKKYTALGKQQVADSEKGAST